MHAAGTDFADLDDDLRLVTLPEAARFLSVSRGALYDLLTTGQLDPSTSAAHAVSRWARSGASSGSVSNASAARGRALNGGCDRSLPQRREEPIPLVVREVLNH